MRSYEEQKAHMLNIRKLAPKSPNKGKFYDQGTRRKRGPNVTKPRMIKALKNSGGVIGQIRRRLRLSSNQAVKNCLKKWPDIKALYDDEVDSVADDAEKSIRCHIRQRKDGHLSVKASIYFLDRKGSHRGYKEKKEVTIEGGNNPLNITSKLVDISSLNLPLELRRTLLNEIEKCTPTQTETPPLPKKKKVIIRRIVG